MPAFRLFRFAVAALLLASFAAMAASPSSLHPLSVALPEATIRFELRDALRSGDTGMLECTYRPRRERDVKQTRRFHLLGSIWRIGSNDLTTVQREEFRVVRRALRAEGGVVRFEVPLHAPEPDYADYQLDEVRVEEFTFARWSEATPQLAGGFELQATPDALGGVAHLDGLGAEPLRGALPLWPALRRVELRVVRADRPALELFDPVQKHHWDGWRQGTPEYWPGGRTFVVRHVDALTVWRAHEYFAVPPAAEAPVERPQPPAGVLPGVALEVFWPTGDTLTFAETNFERAVDVLTFRVANLPARARELLAESVRRRPGLSPGSIGAAEWNELDALASNTGEPAIEFAVAPDPSGRDRLTLQRRNLAEPWLYLFSAEYDDGRRRIVTALLVNPSPWTGPLPE